LKLKSILFEPHKRRQRNYKPDEQLVYKINFETIKIDNGHLQAQVVNAQNSLLFALDLFALKDARFRFKLNELNPLKKRYEVDSEVIVDNLAEEKLEPRFYR
jgi:hypothetical protein